LRKSFSLVLCLISSISVAEDNCYPINRVELIDSSLYQEIEIDYDNCFNNDFLKKVEADIKKKYLDKAYIAPKLSLLPQNVKSGILQIKVQEKKLGKLEYKSIEEGFNKELFWAFPSSNILSLSDMNQGIKNLNRLSSNKAKLQLIERQDGIVDAIVHNQKSKPWKLLFSVDNTSSNRDGRVIGNATAAFDNFLGINDSWIISSSYKPDENKENQDQSKYFMYKQPFGYNMFSVYYKSVELKYLTKLQVNYHPIFVDSEILGFKFDRDLESTPSRNVKITNKLEKKLNFLALRGIPISNYNKSFVSLTSMLENSWLMDNKLLTLKVGFKKGLGLLGGERETSNGKNPRFLMLKLATELKNNIQIKEGETLIYKAELDSQYSFSNIYDTEKTTFGGYNTVRGYPVSTISGYTGFNLRQDFIYHKKDFPIQPFAILDLAYARNIDDMFISSVGFGVKGNIKHLNYELLYARPLFGSFGQDRDNNELYFSLSAGF
jgi:hemolysin activation/secretion protein